MLVVGSQALKNTYFDYREGNNVLDIDLICTSQYFKDIVKNISYNPKYKISELKFVDGGAYVIAHNIENNTTSIVDVSYLDGDGKFVNSNNMIYEHCLKYSSPRAFYICEEPYKVLKATPEIVLMMKESHKYKRNCKHFLKTMQDIKFLREKISEKPVSYYMDDELSKIYKIRCEETYNYSHPNLNQNKQTFFTDEIPYKYDHDTIHAAVKHLDKPAYQYYMKDGEEVQCDKQKFENLPHIVKLYGVLEESYVLALERSVIPYSTDAKKAFDMALMKVCTSITSGWFREFAWEHYDDVQYLYHESYVDKFQEALWEGKIKNFKE